MTDKRKPQKLPFNMKISDEVAKGQYTNIFIINHTENEFILDFGFQGPGAPEVNVLNRIIVTPRQMERFALVLQESLKKYHANYGPTTPTPPKDKLN